MNKWPVRSLCHESEKDNEIGGLNNYQVIDFYTGDILAIWSNLADALNFFKGVPKDKFRLYHVTGKGDALRYDLVS